jgi:hypothetical protein
MHLQVCGEEEKGGNTRARSLASSDRAGRGVERRWARAHNMHVNSPPKFSPKPCMSAASFCCLFLLRVCV